MKFKEYLGYVLDLTSCIEEFCGSRFITFHHSFAEGEDDDDTEFFLLMGDGNGDTLTRINIHQEITFDGDDVIVTDEDDNKISLTFYRSAVIPRSEVISYLTKPQM